MAHVKFILGLVCALEAHSSCILLAISLVVGPLVRGISSTSEVKRARKHALIQECELFKMQKGDSIAEVQKRFTHIVNHLMGLGKEFDKEELNIKVLKCLNRNWQPKVTAISESKDLSIITKAALFG